MNSGVETRNLRYEYYVQIDGKVTAGYRVFADALKAGLLLKQLVRIATSKCATQTSNQLQNQSVYSANSQRTQ